MFLREPQLPKNNRKNKRNRRCRCTPTCLAERVVANGVDLTGLDVNDAEHSRLIEVMPCP